MSAFYKSISLDQIIHVDKINELTPDQQTVLRDELRIAVDEMIFMERIRLYHLMGSGVMRLRLLLVQ